MCRFLGHMLWPLHYRALDGRRTHPCRPTPYGLIRTARRVCMAPGVKRCDLCREYSSRIVHRLR